MIRLRRRRPAAPAPAVDLQRAAVLDVVTAHFERGTPRHDCEAALIYVAADVLAPLIREVVADVYAPRPIR